MTHLSHLSKPSIAVLLPVGPDEQNTEQLATILKDRAGMDCQVYVLVDENRVGWVKMLNAAVKKIDADYFVYTCSDYFPGRNYLRLAYNIMVKGDYKLVGFNDGKWMGGIATAGLIEKNYMKSNYDGELFFNGYKKHCADTELTKKAMDDKVYGFEPHAILMEIDFEKDRLIADGILAKDPIIKEDNELFQKRVKNNEIGINTSR